MFTINSSTLRSKIEAWLEQGRLNRHEFSSKEVIALAREDYDTTQFTLSKLNHALRGLVRTGRIFLTKRGHGGERPSLYSTKPSGLPH